MKSIFPKEIIEQTTQYFIAKNTIRSQVIYGIILLFMAASLASLPFIHVSVFTSARGYIKPNKDRLALTSISAGIVKFNSIKNNAAVVSGDTLLVLQSQNLDEQIALNQKKIEINQNEVHDLRTILDNNFNLKAIVGSHLNAYGDVSNPSRLGKFSQTETET